MTWIKLDDQSVDHPKIAMLSDRAFRWWIKGLCYSSRFLTDGILPAVFERDVPGRVQTELTEAGLWIEQAGCQIQIHDYLQHQRDKASVQRSRAKARDRQSRFRNVYSNAVSNDEVTRLELEESKSKKKKEQEHARDARFESWWEAYPKKVGKGAALKAWSKIRPSDAVCAAMLAALDWQRNQPQWTKDGGAYVPNPQTYLNQARWQDEPFFATTASDEPTFDERLEAIARGDRNY